MKEWAVKSSVLWEHESLIDCACYDGHPNKKNFSQKYNI